MWSYILKLVVLLPLVCGLLIGCLYLWRKLEARLPGNQGDRMLKVRETMMVSTGTRIAVPVRSPDVQPAPLLDMSSGYVARAEAYLPKGADRAPWKLFQNYAADKKQLREGQLEDGVMTFRKAGAAAAGQAAAGTAPTCTKAVPQTATKPKNTMTGRRAQSVGRTD